MCTSVLSQTLKHVQHKLAHCKTLLLKVHKDVSQMRQPFTAFNGTIFFHCKMSSLLETGLVKCTGVEKVLSTVVDADLRVKTEARTLFLNAVNAVSPHQMIWNKINYDSESSILNVNDIEYKLKHNLYVVGFGKAVLGMARAIEDKLGDHMVTGVLSVPRGIVKDLTHAGRQDMLLLESTKFKVIEGASQNLPDLKAHEAAMEIKELVSQVSHSDILIVLISGGGSALLSAPEPPITLEDMLTITKLMSRAGASIIDLNTVRKQIDLLKGGGLAEMAWPAKTISLILSDVIGDPLDFIASGPTVPDCTTPSDVLKLFSELGVMETVPHSVLDVIQGKLQQRENLPTSDQLGVGSKGHVWANVQNVLVGTNKIACEAVYDKSIEFGLLPLILSTEIKGEAREVGNMFSFLAKYITNSLASGVDRDNYDILLGDDYKLLQSCGVIEEKIKGVSEVIKMARESGKRGICIVAGGETTVTVKGDGKGGRNQEMVVAFALNMASQKFPPHVSVVFLSAGTDGQDGPTSSAGAVVSPDFLAHAQESELNVTDYLDRNDTHTLLSLLDNGSSHVITGLTGTNVMDIHILLVKTSHAQ